GAIDHADTSEPVVFGICGIHDRLVRAMQKRNEYDWSRHRNTRTVPADTVERHNLLMVLCTKDRILQRRYVVRCTDVCGLEHVRLLSQPVVIPERRVLQLLTRAQATVERLLEILLVHGVASLGNCHGIVLQIDAIYCLLRGEILDLFRPLVMGGHHPDAKPQDDRDDEEEAINESLEDARS